MTNLITEARELCEKATPGPWYWDVIDAHKCICLESARWKVMDFARYGMNGAAPRFLVDGIMERADTLLKSIPGKEHHRGFDNYIDHPDAAFIARSRTLIPELCDALEKAGAQMPRWIPVSERLPENGRYLTCSVWYGKQMINIDSFSTDRSKVDDYDMRGLGAGFYNQHSESGYFPVDDITHWMPLPAAPEEGGEK